MGREDNALGQFRRSGGQAVGRSVQREFDGWLMGPGDVLPMMPYERFEAWQAAHKLVLRVYADTRKWPKEEFYGLRSQIRRAATSVPLNIAEGSAKRGAREFRRYLDIAIGSLSEVAYCLHLARDLGYWNKEEWALLNREREVVSKLLWRLAETMNRRSS